MAAITHSTQTVNPISINATAELPLKLTSKNFTSWRAQFDALLQGFDLAGYVDGTKQPPAKEIEVNGSMAANPEYNFWLRQDKLILHAIIASTFEAVLPYVATSQTSYAAWQKLLKLFANRTRSRIMDLKSSLTTAKRNDLPIAEYLQKMKQIVDELHLAGTAIDEDDQILYILNGLGPDFRELSIAIRARESSISLEELHDKLISFEVLLKQETESSVIAVPTANIAKRNNFRHRPNIDRRHPRHSSGTNPTSSPSSTTDKPICQICDKVGHNAKQCRKGRYFFNNKPNALYTTASSTGKSWCLDSGASHHVTADLKNLSLASDYDGTDAIQIGDGTGLPITHFGDTTLNSPSTSFQLHEVLCVPSIAQNLVSVSKFCKTNNVSVEFDANKFLVKDLQTQAVLMQGLNVDDVYQFPPNFQPSQPVALSTIRVST